MSPKNVVQVDVGHCVARQYRSTASINPKPVTNAGAIECKFAILHPGRCNCNTAEYPQMPTYFAPAATPYTLNVCGHGDQTVWDPGPIHQTLGQRLGPIQEPHSYGVTQKEVVEFTTLALKGIPNLFSAVEYLHARDMVHNDIHKQNVIVSDGTLKLTDFSRAMAREVLDQKGITLINPLTGALMPVDSFQALKLKDISGLAMLLEGFALRYTWPQKNTVNPAIIEN